MTTATLEDRAIEAKEALDAHLREMIQWHFCAKTGTQHWIEYAKTAKFNPLTDVQTVDDLKLFEHFEDDCLRYTPHSEWIPKAFEGQPYSVFETGGTTGMPKQRIGWNDYKYDYEQFSDRISDEDFPRGGNWLMMGPTGPRRLRLAIEHLANHRGSSCYFIDLDPRWVKKLIKNKHFDQAKAYMVHVVDQAMMVLKHRDVSAIFTTPKLLEALAERTSIPGAGIKGVFVGGTTIEPQMARFLVEEVLENKVGFYPTYGNTLMGLAGHEPILPEDNYSITYHAPEPRAILRVVNPDKTDETVDYGEWGRVELTTLTKELFMPRFLERDEAIRRPAHEMYPWDGVAEVRPFGASTQTIVEGVY